MKLCVVAGEASGDLHASQVIRELKLIDPSLQVFGIGGDLLAAEGVEVMHHAREMAVVGLIEVLRQLPMFRRVFAGMVDRIKLEKPAAILLVDYPDFNLRLAKQCRAMGVKVIYFISPQVWAWRRRRIFEIARVVDQMIVIFPFEEQLYRSHGVPVTYVGHPLVEQLEPMRQTPRAPVEPFRIALLPGSRRSEIRSLLPPMLDAVVRIRAQRSIDPFIVLAPTLERVEAENILRAHGSEVRIVDSDQRNELAGADLSISSSGTATLESAVLGIPVVVVYKLNFITHAIGRRLVKLRHFSLVNIVAGKEIVPELLQEDVNGERIAIEALRLLDPAVHVKVRAELDIIRRRLGERGASRRAAEVIARFAGRNSSGTAAQ